jgi:hypothetical protein
VVIISGRIITVTPSDAHRKLGRGESFGPGRPRAAVRRACATSRDTVAGQRVR